MAKVHDQDFARLPQALVDFKDNVLEVLNFGKAQFQVVTTEPTFAGRAGECLIYRNLTSPPVGRFYAYVGTSWNLVASFPADGA